jgi:hypothetical protein
MIDARMQLFKYRASDYRIVHYYVRLTQHNKVLTSLIRVLQEISKAFWQP